MKIIRIATVLFALQTAALAANGDFISASIDASGRSMSLVFEGLNIGGVYANGLGTDNKPTGTEKLVLTVTSHSWAKSGTSVVPSTNVRTIFGTKWVRKAHPNDAEADETFSGGNTTVRIYLSKHVYADDDAGAGGSGVNITGNLLSGLYTQGGTPSGAASGFTVTNNSTLDHTLPPCHWSIVPNRRVTGDFDLRVVTTHIEPQNYEPTKLVKFTVQDESANSVTEVVEATSIEREVYDQWSTIEHIWTVPVSSLTQGQKLTCNFQAFPWTGDVIYDSTAFAEEPSPHSGPKTFLLDKTGAYGQTVALVATAGDGGVDPGAADATKVYDIGSFNEATAYEFATVQRAVASIVAYNNTVRSPSRNEFGGGIVYIRPGSYSGTSSNTYGTAPACRVEIMPLPGSAEDSVIIDGGTSVFNFGSNDLVTLRQLKVTSATDGTLSGPSNCWWDRLHVNANPSQGVVTDGVIYVTGGKYPKLKGGFSEVGTGPVFALVRGANLDGFSDRIRAVLMCGCRGKNMAGASFTNAYFGDEAQYHSIMQNCSFTGLDIFGGTPGIHGSSFAGNQSNIAVWQCIFELKTSALGNGNAGSFTWLTDDYEFSNGSIVYITVEGGRSFTCYDEGSGVYHGRDTIVNLNCYIGRPATKGDAFDNDPDETGNWYWTNGVGCSGSYWAMDMNSLPNNFFFEFPGLNTYQPPASPGYGSVFDAKFIRVGGARRAEPLVGGGDPVIPGIGDGNYGILPSSPLYQRPLVHAYKWDIDDEPRIDNDATGAKTIPQNALRPKTKRSKVL